MGMEIIERVRCFGGEQLRVKHYASSLNCEMIFALYLPPQAASQPVPLLWWLSGLTCNDQNFVTKAGSQRIAAELGIAIIAPDTSPRGENVADDDNGAYDFGLSAGFYVNATQAPYAQHYRMYDYIQQELPALIAKKFAQIDSSRQSISGHSMGGHGALTLAIKNPAQYLAVSAFAPIVAPSECPWGEKAFSGYFGSDKSTWLAHDACALIRSLGFDKPILVDQGLADNFLHNQLMPEKLQAACAENNVPLTLNLREGYDHSYYFIASFLEAHLSWHANALLR